MKLRAYLVDDEPLALERLRRLLEKTGKVDVMGQATEPEVAVAVLSNDCPDVCFLDIEMPRLNAFDVLARLPKQPIVIFTTAYDRYALQAFGVNSVDYLLKPIDPEDLERALDKVERLGGAGSTAQNDLHAVLKNLAESLQQASTEYPSRIASRLGDRLWFIDLSRVTHFYAADKLTYAVSGNKAYCVDSAITELEKKLDPRKFVRIHRSSLVNLDWIKEVASLPGGTLSVRLKDEKETELIVARDRARQFKERAGC
ncbi:MAG TPA: LytTR family transcriptional regulator DNA-binding domain-containing protein [Terriglobales bacterium]